MAELKLSTIWQIQNFHEQNAQAELGVDECLFDSEELGDFNVKSLPGVTWAAELFTSSPDKDNCREGCAGFFLFAYFGPGHPNGQNVWASYTTTLLDADSNDLMSHAHDDAVEFSEDEGNGDDEAFQLEDLNKAVRKDGSLWLRIDLTILKVEEILKCSKLVRCLLKDASTADFTVQVAGESFKLHKSVLTETSPVFAQMMLESGLETPGNGVLTLPDSNPAAFKAFSEAIYYDNWDFLSDTELTQGVLYLAVFEPTRIPKFPANSYEDITQANKFIVADLKRFCDESLAEKIDEGNALQILTTCAALCEAEKTNGACIEFLAEHMGFKESQTWLDFKERNPSHAVRVLDVISDKLEASCTALRRERDAADAGRSHRFGQDGQSSPRTLEDVD